jgi:hypothetical protein
MSMTTNSFHGFGWQPFQEGSEGSFGRRDVSFGSVELIPRLGEIAPQRPRVRPCISRGVSDVGAAGCPDSDQAFGCQHPHGCHHGVRRDPKLSCEVSIRRESCTRGVLGAAGYVGAQGIRHEVPGGFALVIGHILSVHAFRLKTLIDMLRVSYEY